MEPQPLSGEPADAGQSAANERPTNTRWLIFVLACGTSWFLYLHRYCWNFIGPKLREEYQLSQQAVATLGSAFNWGYSSGQIPSGIVCDFFGPHLFLGVIMSLWCLALPLQGAVRSFYGLFGVRLLFGVGQAGAYPALSKVTHTWFPKRSRTVVQGWVASFSGRGGGAMSSIIMGSLLMGTFGLSWRAALWVLAGGGLLFATLFLILFRDSPVTDLRVNSAEKALIREGRVESSQDTRQVLPWRRAFQHRSMRFFVLQQFTSAGADCVYSLFMGGYFLEARGIDILNAGFLISLPLWGGAIGGMLGGYCNDLLIRRTGNRRWARSVVGFTGNSLACLLMFVAISREHALAAGLALFVVKFFSDWSQPTVWGACTDLGGKYSATILGIINTSGTLGGVVLPPIYGWLLDLNASQQTVGGISKTVFDYSPLFTCVAILYVISGCCWLFTNCADSVDRDEQSADGASVDVPRCGVFGVLLEFQRLLFPLFGALGGTVVAHAHRLPRLETLAGNEWWLACGSMLLESIGLGGVGAAAGWAVGRIIYRLARR